MFIDDVIIESEKILLEDGPFHSLHEAHSVLEEEYLEFWDEVRKKRSKRVKKDILHELVQIAAICNVIAENYPDK